jgi:hypothetical protein
MTIFIKECSSRTSPEPGYIRQIDEITRGRHNSNALMIGGRRRGGIEF